MTTIIYGKLGKVTHFGSGEWGAAGGDNEPLYLLLKLAQRHPDVTWVFGTPYRTIVEGVLPPNVVVRPRQKEPRHAGAADSDPPEQRRAGTLTKPVAPGPVARREAADERRRPGASSASEQPGAGDRSAAGPRGLGGEGVGAGGLA